MVDRFPQQVSLRDGRPVLVRRLDEGDADLLYDFFLRLPPRVRQFAWDNIEDRGLIEHWCRNIDFARVLPLVALSGGRIVADATLHFREHGPLRRVGRIKWLLDPELRGVGLGTTLINDLIAVARTDGLRHLTCMLIRDLEEDAVETLKSLGFEDFVIPRYGTDPEGGQHDMVKLVLEL